MTNKLITIGTGNGFAVRGKGGSAHLVQVDGEFLLFDCGEGAAGWLNHLHVLHRIKRIFISHLHADHTTGLFMVLQNMMLAGRCEPLEVYMPEDGIEPFSRMQEAVYLSRNSTSTDMFEVIYLPVSASLLFKDDNCSVRAWLSDHFINDRNNGGTSWRFSYGFTVETAASRLVYTGDVSTIDCFRDEMTPDSTILCEAMHIEPATAVEAARERKVRQVVFTHVDPPRAGQIEQLCRGSGIAVAAVDGLEINW
ncbi:MAG TPA: MBL fold metallo-hydrolase [Bacteroidetes bacterium]|nr:MBL fold metallo-hydrolase [Bacteroidota bacterium]